MEIKSVDDGASDNGARTKFQNYSRASKLRQSLIPKEVRRQRASLAAKALHANRTPEQRRLHAVRMNAAKQNGKKIK